MAAHAEADPTAVAFWTSEQKYRTMFETIDQGFGVMELVRDEQGDVRDLIFREVNASFERHTGLGNVVDRSVGELLPNLERHWLDIYTQVSNTGEPVVAENYVQDVGRWFHTHHTRVGGSGSPFVAVAFDDITVRKQAEAALRESERRQTFLLRLADALRSLTGDIALLETAARLFGEYLDADRAFFGELIPAQDLAVMHPDFARGDLPTLAGRFKMSDFQETVTALEKGPYVVADVARSERLSERTRAAYLALGYASFFSVPLVRAGTLLNLSAVSRRPRHWTAADVQLASEVAERTWTKVEQARADVALRERGAWLKRQGEALMHAVNGAPLETSLGVLVTTATEALGEGARAAFYLAGSGGEGLHIIGMPADGAAALDGVAVEPDPSDGWSFPIHSAAGTLVGTLAVHWRAPRDATDRDKELASLLTSAASIIISRHRESDIREHAEAALREKEERQTFLLKLTDTLRPLADATEIQAAAMRVLGEHLHVHRAFYAEVRDDNETITIGPGYTEGLSPIAEQFTSSDFDLDSMTVHRTGRTVVIDDLYGDVQLSAQAKAAFDAVNVKALISVPLMQDGRVRALASVHQRDPRRWTAVEVALVEETAERTWAAVGRARAERALRGSEHRYRTLFETIDEGFVIGELVRNEHGDAVDFLYLEANPALERLTGGTVEGTVGRRLGELAPPDERRYWVDAFATLAASRVPVRLEHFNEPLKAWFRVNATSGGGDRIFTAYQNITDEKRAEAALRDIQERQAFLLKLSDAFRANPDEAAIGVMCVEALARHMGVDRCYITEMSTELNQGTVGPEYYTPGLSPIAGVHSYADFPDAVRRFKRGEPLVVDNIADDPSLTDLDRASIGGGLNLNAIIVTHLYRGEGNSIWALTVGTVDARAWTGDDLRLVQDVGERTWAAIQRARAEATLRDSEERLRGLNEQLEERVRERTSEVRLLFERLVSVQEEERRRIARDIHDQVGQQMTALRMNLEVLHTQANGRTALAEQTDRIQQLAEDLDQSIDFLTWQLRPAALDHLGLSAALQNLVTGWSERFAIPADFAVDGVEDVRLPRDVEANLYRIAQEALHNIAKHARATQVTLYLMRQNGNLVMLIEDNGRGFDVDRDYKSEDGRGMGLMSMHERAALVGGRLEITSAADHGTSICVRVVRD